MNHYAIIYLASIITGLVLVYHTVIHFAIHRTIGPLARPIIPNDCLNKPRGPKPL